MRKTVFGETLRPKIKAPHCKEFRGNYDIGFFLSKPVASAFKNIGLEPETGSTEDLTFEQRFAIFDFIANDALNVVEEDYYHKTDYHYHWQRFVPPVDYIDRHYTLKEWNDKGRAYVEERIANMVKAQTAMRNMSGYDWSPIAFLFGADLERFAQLKTATLNAEMEASRGIFKREYDDFLDAVQRTSQMGTMRNNEIRLESVFLDKYRISISIRDTGGGARFSRAVRENELVCLAKDIGSVGKELFNFLFGKK